MAGFVGGRFGEGFAFGEGGVAAVEPVAPFLVAGAGDSGDSSFGSGSGGSGDGIGVAFGDHSVHAGLDPLAGDGLE